MILVAQAVQHLWLPLQETGPYYASVTNEFGCVGTDSMNIKTFCLNTQVFIPNAFSPDGDGVNDILMVRGKGIGQVRSFRIFSRWGELVFEKTNFQPNDPALFGWDGRVKRQNRLLRKCMCI